MNSLNNSYNRYNNQPDPNLLNLREQQLYRGSTSEQRVVQATLRNPLNYQYSPNYKNEPANSNSINEYQRQQYTSPQYDNNQQGYYYQQDKGYRDIQNDPQYQRNLHKFYAVNEPPPPQKSISNVQRNQVNANINMNNGQYRNNNQNSQQNNSYGNQALMNDPQFQANLHKFYAVNEPPPPQRRPININNQYQNNVNNKNNGQYRANIQNSQLNNGYVNQALMNDPQFQANLHKFYAVNEPPPPQRRPININNQYTNKFNRNNNKNNGQYQANNGQGNQALMNDPQFQANLHKFYAVNEMPPPQKRQLNKIQTNNGYLNQPSANNAQYQANLHKFYAVNEPPPPQKRQLNKNIGNGNQLNMNNAQYQANLHKFYAVNEPPPPQKISLNNGNRNIGQGNQHNINNPQYQANLHKFYAVNEPAPPPKRAKQQNNGYGNPSKINQNHNKRTLR